MKNKFLASILGLLLFIPTLLGETVTLNTSGAETNSVLQDGAAIYKITVANSSGATATVRFINAPTNELTYVVGAYTNNTISNITVTNIYEDPLGNDVTNTYSALTNVQTVQAESTNNWDTITTLTVADGATTVYSPVNPAFVTMGVLVTNDTNVDVTIDYAPFQ